ncbi:MAG: hypothetical protein JNJ54_13625 [Myxococcaceae bacterium]|nr:hypothetical protein [Myxococcaceae bacterium]
MGALSLLKPSVEHERCEHPRCVEVRRLAEVACQVCGRPNGYGVAIYPYRKRLGHAGCIDAAHENALHAFIKDLAELAVDQFRKGHFPPPMRLAGPSEEGGACRHRCKHAECAEHRKLASTPCFKCIKPLGYRRAHVFRREGYAHASCVNQPEDKAPVSKVERSRTPAAGSQRAHTMMLPEFDIDVTIPVNSRKLPGAAYRATAQIGGSSSAKR